MDNQHPPYEHVLQNLNDAIEKVDSLYNEVKYLKEQLQLKDNHIVELQKAIQSYEH